MTSLSAELSAERKVGEETKKDLAIVRAEASRYQEQVRAENSCERESFPLEMDELTCSFPVGSYSSENICIVARYGSRRHSHKLFRE